MASYGGAQFGCFDLSGFQGLPQSTVLIYQNQWYTYNRIQAFNLNISTLRQQGNKGMTYYVYSNSQEQTDFLNGQMLHARRFPNSNWAAVPKD